MFETVKQSIARFIYRSVSYSVRNSYEAGSTGRRLSRWNPPSSGPNASIIGDLERLRARSRELCPVQYSDIGPARRIYAGIEFNLIGKRTAYWMVPLAPGRRHVL